MMFKTVYSCELIRLERLFFRMYYEFDIVDNMHDLTHECPNDNRGGDFASASALGHS